MNGDRPGVIVQARMGSTRLPGKVMARVQGHSLLGHLLLRLRRLERSKTVVVATTEAEGDAILLEEAERYGALPFRGSENDVLQRYLEASRAHGIDPLVRITSDCPLADPALIDEALRRWQAGQERDHPPDIVTNTRAGLRSYPRGLDVEVVSRAALEAIDDELPPDAAEREHVTQALYQRLDRFRIADLMQPVSLAFLRWTVDTGDDLTLIRRIYDALYPTRPEFDTADVLSLLEREPELLAINAQVRQKPLTGSAAS